MMHATKIALSLVAILTVTLLVIGGIGHNDEVHYVVQDGRSRNSEVTVNIQNTGHTATFFGLVGVRRYGPPFQLFIDLDLPMGTTESVTLRDFKLRASEREILSIRQLILPVHSATVFQGGRRHERSIASYAHPELLTFSDEELTARGTFRYSTTNGPTEQSIDQNFKRVHERGIYIGL